MARATKKNSSGVPLCRMPTVSRELGDSGQRMPAYEANIAAIDFGTTYCSLAFKTRGDLGETVVRLDGANQRVPNAILLKIEKEESICMVCKEAQCADKQQSCTKAAAEMVTKQYICKVRSFGDLAQVNYQRLRKNEYSNHFYFERVKIGLMQKGLHRAMKIRAANGREFYLVEVIAITLKYLKDLLMSTLHLGGHTDLKVSDFLWVVTVPAIWGARGKQIMREAAYLAGLCSDDIQGINYLTSTFWNISAPVERHPERVILALEPEAAALSCQELTGQMKLEKYCEAAPIPASQSLRYLVVDIGGGTVDIAAHLVGETSNVEIPPMGNEFGGTAVNRAFQQFFSEVICSETIAAFVEEDEKNKANFNALFYYKFEKEKITFGDTMDCTEVYKLQSESLVLNFDQKFCRAFGNDLKKIGATHPWVECTHDDDMLHIKYSKIAELFQPAVDGIIECMLTALKEVELKGKVDVIYLVGGFGGCKYIYSQVKAAMEARPGSPIRVVVPGDHNLAVVRGAVRFGANPQVISNRKADTTYGMAVSIPFKKGHDKFYSYKDARGKVWSNDVFSVCVEKGESIDSGKVYTQTVSPPDHSQKTMKLELLMTDKTGVQYIRDKDGKRTVERAGCLVIDLSERSSSQHDSHKINVTLDFSGTELKARAHFAKEQDDTKDINVIIDCL